MRTKIKATPQAKATLPNALKYCGLLGHAFVTLRPDSDKTHGDGQWSCCAESNQLRDACRWLNGAIPEGWRVFQNTRIFERKWREIPKSRIDSVRADIDAKEPKISQRAFFALPEIIALQEIQKRNPHGSSEHRKAFDDAKTIAATYNAASFFGEY